MRFSHMLLSVIRLWSCKWNWVVAGATEAFDWSLMVPVWPPIAHLNPPNLRSEDTKGLVTIYIGNTCDLALPFNRFAHKYCIRFTENAKKTGFDYFFWPIFSIAC